MSTTEYQYSIGLCQFTARLRGGRTLDKPVLETRGVRVRFSSPAHENRQLVTRKSGISNLVEKKTQDMETRIIEVKVRLIGQRNQHELHWRFS